MSKIQLRSHDGAHQLVIDGRDVSSEVLRGLLLEIPENFDQEPVLTVKFAVDDAVEVKRA